MNITPTDWLSKVLGLTRSTTILHGISASPDTIRTRQGATAFGFQGRLVTTKGIKVLLEAVEILRAKGLRPRLKVIGGGPELSSLKSSVEPCGSNVEFLGHVPNDRLEEILADVSTIIMPSLAGEVFGLVAVENMLRGKLVLVSDLGALKEVVGDSGLTFINGDVEDLAARMEEILADSAIAASLGSAARVRAAYVFASKIMVENHIRLYRTAFN
jgi:glycosyltransferase involved in cell wall biosynthesis